MKEDGLGIESKLDLFLDDSFDEEKMMKKFVIEGFPKNRTLSTISGHRSISIFVENEMIKIIDEIPKTVECEGCGYQIEKSNYFLISSQNRRKRVCRLCFTLSEASKKTISFEKKDDEG